MCTKYLVCIKWDLARNILKVTKWDFFFYFMSSHFYKPQQFSQTTFTSRNIIALLIYHIHLISKRQHITYWYLPSYTRGFSFHVNKLSYNFPKFEAHIKHHFSIDKSTCIFALRYFDWAQKWYLLCQSISDLNYDL